MNSKTNSKLKVKHKVETYSQTQNYSTLELKVET